MARKRLTDQEKADRKNARKADQLTAKAAEQFGPLFAHLAPTYTPADAAEHTRRVRVEAVERLHVICQGAARTLGVVNVDWIEHEARKHLGERFAEVKAHGLKVYRDWYGYAYTFWCSVLTGERIVYEWNRGPLSPNGTPTAVPSRWVQLDPAPFTREEFHARYLMKLDRPDICTEDDPAGLFPRVMAALTTRS